MSDGYPIDYGKIAEKASDAVLGKRRWLITRKGMKAYVFEGTEAEAETLREGMRAWEKVEAKKTQISVEG